MLLKVSLAAMIRYEIEDDDHTNLTAYAYKYKCVGLTSTNLRFVRRFVWPSSTYVGVQVQSEALQEDLFAIIYLQSDALHLYLHRSFARRFVRRFVSICKVPSPPFRCKVHKDL